MLIEPLKNLFCLACYLITTFFIFVFLQELYLLRTVNNALQCVEVQLVLKVMYPTGGEMSTTLLFRLCPRSCLSVCVNSSVSLPE